MKSCFQRFDNLDALVAFTENTPPCADIPKGKYATQDARIGGDNLSCSKFMGTATFAEAVDLARRGWPEGLKSLRTAIDASTIFLPSASLRTASLDVGGAFPLVPVAVAGDPACMVTIGEELRATQRIYRFVVNFACLAHVTPAQILNRGAALLAWVDALEAAGARVEIIALRSSKTPAQSKDFTNHTVAFTAKRPDEHLDMDRLAFVLMHRSMMRRFAFACQDRAEGMAYTVKTGRGTSHNWLHPDLHCPHSVYFPCLADNASDYDTPESAERVTQQIIAQGMHAQDNQEPA